MGVHDLWRILEPSCDVISFDKLTGKTIAIDLSGWAVDSQCVESSRPGAPPNLNLRNLFHRTSALLIQGIEPVFVIEGKSPELKNKVIQERINAREGNNKNEQPKSTKVNRSRLNSILKQCQKLLNLMGLTCIKADGEAEATCSYLNADGLVDGVISQDNDCFLYGAKIVYRDFKMTSQSSDEKRTVKEYSIDKIEQLYKLGREKMIALALLCGCDYTDGVPRVGKTMAMKFLNVYSNDEILDIMRGWKLNNQPESTKEAEAVRKKCKLTDDFPNEEVIDEYTKRKYSIPRRIDKWKCPDGAKLIEYLTDTLNWTPKEAFDKVFPLMTRWQVFHPEILLTSSESLIMPKEIVKTRVQRGIPSYEIQWEIPNKEDYALIRALMDEPVEMTTYNTFEPREAVQKTYPALVEIFEDSKNKTKKKTTSKDKDGNGNKKIKASSKKKDEVVASRRIDEYFQQRKVSSSNTQKSKMKRKSPEIEPTQQKKEKITPALDDSIKRLFDDLSPDDFDVNVDADSADMSLIVERTCSQSELFVKVKGKATSRCASPLPLTPIMETPKQSEIIDLSLDDDDNDDDDLIYVPLSQRIKSKVS